MMYWLTYEQTNSNYLGSNISSVIRNCTINLRWMEEAIFHPFCKTLIPELVVMQYDTLGEKFLLQGILQLKMFFFLDFLKILI